MIITGKAIKYGENVNTDVIIPGKYLILTDPAEMAKHAMEGLDPDFVRKAQEEIVIVAGRNFGCGSSREHAPLALKHAGVKGILADSFARIFYRNAINIGLSVLECPEASARIDEGDVLEIDLGSGLVTNQSKRQVIQATQLPTFILEILRDGGLIENLKKEMRSK